MTAWIVSALLVLIFIVLVRRFQLVENSKIVLAVARRSVDVIRNPDITDDDKEAALQNDAKQLFRLFVLLSLGGAATVLVPVALLWLSDKVGFLSTVSVLAVALSPTFISISIIVSIFVMYLSARSTPKSTGFSLMDRILYRLAFKTYTAQIAIADFEDRMLKKQLSQCDIDRPVFITALPRSGTTLLLECFASVREFASHTYRDMPFVLIPYLWSSFSASYRRTDELRERAHGDGMLISYDSPEALEEMLWKRFWKQHYRSDHITPWQDEENSEFSEFFLSHMRKIILLRRGNDAPSARYVSKNNLNIARILTLRRLFPDSTIIIPFRQPLHHTSSLLEQHLNFLGIHKQDAFACKYMRELGHYDFGENLRPVNFNGWLENKTSEYSDSLSFWLEYWIASYSHLLAENAGSIHFLSYDGLCADPAGTMSKIAELTESSYSDELISSASGIHSTRPRIVYTEGISETLLREAERIHTLLSKAAIN